MRVFLDLESHNATGKPGVPTVVTFLNFKRANWFNFEVQFHLNGRIMELPADSTGMFEIKPVGKFDADPIAGASSWHKTFQTEIVVTTVVDPVTGIETEVETVVTIPESVVYHFIINFITVPLDELFKVDLNLDNDVEMLKLMGEIEWVIGGLEHKSQTFEVRLYNDIIRDGDVLPDLPPVSHGFFIPSITSLTGGTPADLDALPTVGIMTGTIIQILVADLGMLQWLTYVLQDVPAGTPPGVVEPLDYDAVDNARRWTGAVGPSGPTGRSAGARYTWSTDVTETDPTPGKLKINAGATELYISETDLDGNSLEDILASWDDGTSTVRGRIMIQDPVIVENFAAFDITGTRTDTGDWDTFNITHVASGGTLSNGLQVNVMFIAKGDKGDAGPIGPGGLPYLWNTATDETNPGDGKIKVNDTIVAATALYISEINAAGNDMEPYLPTFVNSSSTIRGQIHLIDPDSDNFVIYNVIGVITDFGTWVGFEVAYVSGNGTFAADTPLRLAFIPTGDKGDTGDTGPEGESNVAGTPWFFNTDTAESDPTYGNFKMSDSDGSAATELYISTNNSVGQSWEGLLTKQMVGNVIYIRKPDALEDETPGVYRVTAPPTDNTGWVKIPIEYVEGFFSFYDLETLDEIIFDFVGPIGDPITNDYDTPADIEIGVAPVVDLSLVAMSTLRLLAGNTVVDLINPVPGKVTILHFKQAASGTSWTVTFSDTIIWVGTGGAAPVMSPGFNVVDAFTIWYDGTNLYGSWAPGA